MEFEGSRQRQRTPPLRDFAASAKPARHVPALEPRSLPVPPTSLVGRANAARALAELIAQPEHRLVTVTGPAGVGKTRLAIAAAELLDERGRFADGIAFTPLAALRDPALIEQALLRGLGLPVLAGSDPGRWLERVLRDRHILIVIDNMEHLLVATPVLSRLLAAAPDVQLLVTSRAPLSIAGERVVPLAPLAVEAQTGQPSEAARLFFARAETLAAASNATSSISLVNEICRRLDGLPLAIELAAARAAELTPDALLQRIDRRLALRVDGAHDVPARLRSVRDAVAWSYDILSPAERQAFCRLSVTAGAFDLEFAIRLVRANRDPAAFEAVSSLVRHNLLQPITAPATTPRFAMLETMRDFGLERLAESGELATARDVHAAQVLELATATAESGRSLAARDRLDRLEQHIAEFRIALAWLEQQERGEEALQLADAARTLWWIGGRLAEGRRALQRTLAAAPNADMTVRVRALAWLGILAAAEGELEIAQQASREAIALLPGISDVAIQIDTMRHAGQVAGYAGDEIAAQTWFRTALQFAEDHGQPRPSPVLIELGSSLIRTGDHETAVAVFEEAYAALSRLGPSTHLTLAEIGLGHLAVDAGDPMRAQRHVLTAFRSAYLWHDASVMAEALVALAPVAAPSLAVRLLGAGDALRTSTGRRRFRYHLRFEQTLGRLRAAVSPASFESGWTAGAKSDPAVLIETILTANPHNTPALSLTVTTELTRREREVLRLLAAGLSDRQIAELLSISRATASNHVASILGKLDVPSRAGAVTAGFRLGLIDPS